MIEKQEANLPPEEPAKTFIKGLALHAFGQGGGAANIDTKDGRIVRIRPLHYDEKYTPEEIGQWRVEDFTESSWVGLQKTSVLPQPD